MLNEHIDYGTQSEWHTLMFVYFLFFEGANVRIPGMLLFYNFNGLLKYFTPATNHFMGLEHVLNHNELIIGEILTYHVLSKFFEVNILV